MPHKKIRSNMERLNAKAQKASDKLEKTANDCMKKAHKSGLF